MTTKVKTMRRPRGEKTQSKTINLPIDQFERITRIASRSNRSFSWVLSDLLSQKDLAASASLDRRMVEAPTPILPAGSMSGLDNITEILADVRDEHLVGLRGRVNALPGELETTLSTAIAVAVERETEGLRESIKDLRLALNTKLSVKDFSDFESENAADLRQIRDEIIEGITDFISETSQGGHGPKTTSATEEPHVDEPKASVSESIESVVAARVSQTLKAQLKAIKAGNQIDLEKAFQTGGSKSASLFQKVNSVLGRDRAGRISVTTMISAMALVDEKNSAIPANQIATTVSLIERHITAKDGRENRTVNDISRIAGALARAIAQGAFENLAAETGDRIDAALASLQKGAALEEFVAAVEQAIADKPQYRIQ